MISGDRENGWKLLSVTQDTAEVELLREEKPIEDGLEPRQDQAESLKQGKSLAAGAD